MSTSLRCCARWAPAVVPRVLILGDTGRGPAIVNNDKRVDFVGTVFTTHLAPTSRRRVTNRFSQKR